MMTTERMKGLRVGRKLGRTLYRGDELIGIMDRAEDAAAIVAMSLVLSASDQDRDAVLEEAAREAEDEAAQWKDAHAENACLNVRDRILALKETE